MSRNESGLDRIIRVIIAIAAIAGAAVVGFGTVGAWVLLVVAAIMLVTAATGFCPLYRVFGMSTCRVRAGAVDRHGTMTS
jgi:hypothetical protein